MREERLPVDECASPTESSIASESEYDEESEEDDSEEHVPKQMSVSIEHHRASSVGQDNFLMLRNLLGQTTDAWKHARTVGFDGSAQIDAESVADHQLEPEVVQLHASIAEIMSNLYQLSRLIRRPIPGDRLTRSAKIDVHHFEFFDNGYVRDCFPCSQPWLQKRLAKAITRRRQHLIYNRKHHEHLARPKAPTRTSSKLTGIQEEPISFTAPNTVIDAATGLFNQRRQAPLTAKLASTHGVTSVATSFLPPNREMERDDGISEADTRTSFASTMGGGKDKIKDRICIPPRPKDEEGHEKIEFECPYCFRIQEIHSARAWQ